MGIDYAKCQGLFVNNTGYSPWWTRSPYYNFQYKALLVKNDGGSNAYDITNTYLGVRPVCWINL